MASSTFGESVRLLNLSLNTPESWQMALQGDATLYHATQVQRWQDYQAGLAAGKYRPLLFPWDFFPLLYLILALMFTPHLPRPYGTLSRWAFILAIHAHIFYMTQACRMTGLLEGYGTGFFFSWACVMSLDLLVFNDVKADFKRLEARPLPAKGATKEQENGSAISESNTPAVSTAVSTDVTARLRQQQQQQQQQQNQEVEAENPTSASGNNAPYLLEWQAYPSNLLHRLDWIMDLLLTFRGINWSFRPAHFPKIPLPGNDQAENAKVVVKSPRTIQQIQISGLLHAALWYLIFDTIKTIHSDDAFYSGVISFFDPPAKSNFYSGNMIIVMLVRLHVTMLSVYSGLSLLFSLAPLFYSLVVPSILPYPALLHLTYTPLVSPFMYEPFGAPFFSSIARRGLGGFWGDFWHDLLRFGISQPGIYVVKQFKLDWRSSSTRMLTLMIAFVISAYIHAAGSYTSFPPIPGAARPISRTFTFFILQGVGIALQTSLTRAIGSRKYPLPVRQVANFMCAWCWLLLTAPGLAEDLARCGVWLSEPLPVSIIRGVRGQGWWRWNPPLSGWWIDPKGRFWETGYAIY